jgi:NAD(P)-dependent dehydrogenase (short-subunit alcohol dehydrogenase family)
MPNSSSSQKKTWVITGPTSGIGRWAALELAHRGTVVLVGRDPGKLRELEQEINILPQGHAVAVVADFADVESVRHAAEQITSLGLSISGVANNAGGMQIKGGVSKQGWDIAFATNHLGPLAFTEALIPHLPNGAVVTFTASGVEDPDRKPATQAGFRGSRYISAMASARGEFLEGGSTNIGFDAYATSKQGNLATVFSLAREHPRLRFRAVEPGFNPGTGLSRDANPALRWIARYVMQPLAPLIPYWSTPKRAGKLLADTLTDSSDATGVYYDENGKPMKASKQVSDAAFADRFIAESRDLLSTVPEAG